MSNNYITEEEYDSLSDYQARNYVYCHDCNCYHIKGGECPCNLPKHLKIIANDSP